MANGRKSTGSLRERVGIWRIAGIGALALSMVGLLVAVVVNQNRVTPETIIANPISPDDAMRAQQAVTIPDDPRLLVLGDSYTLGTAAGRDNGYAALVVRSLGWPAEIDGVGGTGFTWGGGDAGTDGNDYASRIKRRSAAGEFAPNVLLLQGGQNDYRATPDQVEAAVTATVEAARIAWPGVQIIVMGPSQPMPGGALLKRVSAPIGRAALAVETEFISPLNEDWFTDQNSPGFYGDANGAHPNIGGHRHIADKVLERLRRLGATIA